MATKTDYWVPFDGQSLSVGDHVNHCLYGVCVVEVATPHSLKLVTKKKRIRIDANPKNLTHYWEFKDGDRANLPTLTED